MRAHSIYVQYCFAVVGLLALGYAVSSTEAERHISAQRLDATRANASFSGALERGFTEHMLLTQAVRAAFEAEPSLTQAQFEQIVRRFEGTSIEVLNVAAAPDLVIQFVYPVEPNLAALGVDLAEIPYYREAINESAATGEITLNGPVDLVQGGQGFITRAAIVLSDAPQSDIVLWGVVSVVVDSNLLFASAAQQLQNAGVAIRVTNDQGELLFETGDQPILEPVTNDVAFSSQIWTIETAPRDGWETVSPFNEEIWVSVLALSLLGFALTRWIAKAAKRAQTAELQLHEAVNALDDGFALFDNDSNFVMCNDKYRDIYAASAEALIPGASFESILRFRLANDQYIDAIGRQEEWLAERLEAHQNSGVRLEQELIDGRWLRVVERKTASGNKVGFRVDITELKNALKKAEAASKAKTTFLNTVSHELRTPLTVVLGYNAFIAHLDQLPTYQALEHAIERSDATETSEALANLRGDLTRFATQIDGSGKQLMALISGILDLAAIEERTARLETDVIEIDDFLHTVIEQFRPLAEETGIRLGTEIDPHFVLADPTHLKQILFNLIENALKFTSEGAVIVRAGRDGENAWIEVEDTGLGIAAEHTDSIFDRFVQVGDDSENSTTGVGLGLSISKELAIRNGGTLEARSILGKGSVFRLVLRATERVSIAAE